MDLKEAYNVLTNEIMNKKEKEAFCKSLGFPVSNKTKDIEKMVLEAIRDERNAKNAFDEDDARFFFRISDYKTSYKSLKEYLDKESLEFIKFLKDFMYTAHNVKGIMQRYSICPADRDKVMRYNSVVRYLEESTSEFQGYMKRIENCYLKLESQLGEFKKMYLQKAKEVAEQEWGSKKTVKTLEKYVNAEVDSAERYYSFALRSLSERLVRSKVNEENLVVKFIGEDMKLFEIVIEDGEKEFHGRAIICAEYSSIVRTHVRFIISSKN